MSESALDTEAVAHVFRDGPLAGITIPKEVMAVWPSDVRPSALHTNDADGNEFYSVPLDESNSPE